MSDLAHRDVKVSSSATAELWLSAEPDIITLEFTSSLAAHLDFVGLWPGELYHVYIDSHAAHQELYASPEGTLQLALDAGWHLVELSIPSATLLLLAGQEQQGCEAISATNPQGDVVFAEFFAAHDDQPARCTLPPDSKEFTISDALYINASKLVFDCQGATIDGRSSSIAVGLSPEFGQLSLRNCRVLGTTYGVAAYRQGPVFVERCSFEGSSNPVYTMGLSGGFSATNNTILHSSDQGGGFSLNGANAVTLADNTSQWGAAAIQLNECGNVEIRDNEIDHPALFGIVNLKAGPSLITGNTLRGGQNALWIQLVHDDILQISHNRIEDSINIGLNFSALHADIHDNIWLRSQGDGVYFSYDPLLENGFAPEDLDLRFYRNSFIERNTTQAFKLGFEARIAGALSSYPIELSYQGQGNYWGHDAPPLFIAGPPIGQSIPGTADSSAPQIVDSFAYCAQEGWNLGYLPGQCESPEPDQDGDSIPDATDNCPALANPDQTDVDSDGIGDACDNCPQQANTDQLDRDQDGAGDLCDLCPADNNKIEPGLCGCFVSDEDRDGDGTVDCQDACPIDVNKIEPGNCGCLRSDFDYDQDGTPNCNDPCLSDPNKVEFGICGCGHSDVDTDADGLADCVDNCPMHSNPDQQDRDQDGLGDACDAEIAVVTPSITEPLDGQVQWTPLTLVRGLAPGAERVELLVNGARQGEIYPTDEAFAFVLPEPLGPGRYNLQVRGFISSFASSASTPIALYVGQTQVLAPTIDSPAPEQVLLSETVALSGQGLPLATIHLILDGVELASLQGHAEDGRFALMTQIASGEHSLVAYQEDVIGQRSPDSEAVSFTVQQYSPASPYTSDRRGINVVGYQTSTPAYDPSGEPPLTTHVTIAGRSTAGSVHSAFAGSTLAVVEQIVSDSQTGEVLDTLVQALPIADQATIDLQTTFTKAVSDTSPAITLNTRIGVGMPCKGNSCKAPGRVDDVIFAPEAGYIWLRDYLILTDNIPVLPGADLNVRRVDEDASRQANPVFNPAFNPPRHDGMWLFPVHERGGSTKIVDLFDPAQLQGYVACASEKLSCPNPEPGQDPSASCPGLNWNDLIQAGQEFVYAQCITHSQAKTWALKLRAVQGVDLSQIDHVEVLTDRLISRTRPPGLVSSSLPTVSEPYQFMQDMGLRQPFDIDDDPVDVVTRVLTGPFERFDPLDPEEPRSDEAWIQIRVKDHADPGLRRLRLVFDDGNHQDLTQIGLYVGRNGEASVTSVYYPGHNKYLVENPASIHSVQGGMIKDPNSFSPEARLLFNGVWPLGEAMLYDNDGDLETRCMFPPEATEEAISSNTEEQIILRGRFIYRKQYPQANDPFDRCQGLSIFDKNMQAAIRAYQQITHISDQTFNYLRDPFGREEGPDFIIGPSTESLLSRPGILGDSLSQGVYGGTVEPKTQHWAFPSRILEQMRTGVSPSFVENHHEYFQNYFWQGINIEDVYNMDINNLCVAEVPRDLNYDLCSDLFCDSAALFSSLMTVGLSLCGSLTVGVIMHLVCDELTPNQPIICYNADTEQVRCHDPSVVSCVDENGDTLETCPQFGEIWQEGLAICNDMVNLKQCADMRTSEVVFQIEPPVGHLTCPNLSSPIVPYDPMQCFLPRNHVGVSGFDYSYVLHSNIETVDLRTGNLWSEYYPNSSPPYNGERAQLAGAAYHPESQSFEFLDLMSPIERMESFKPSFMLATAANNPALGAAAKTDISFLDWGKFVMDGQEVYDRLKAIEEVQGGLIFSTPALGALAYFDDRDRDQTRDDCESIDDEIVGKVAFWRNREMGACLPENVLDAEEQSILDSNLIANAAELKQWSHYMHYAYVDMHNIFRCLGLDYAIEREESDSDREFLQKDYEQYSCADVFVDSANHSASIGELRQMLVDDQSLLISPIIPDIEPINPVAELGIFGLDGIHPNQFGHALMAYLMIQELNRYYGLDIPPGGDSNSFGQTQAGIWLGEEYRKDSLINHPIAIKSGTNLNLRDYWVMHNYDPEWQDVAAELVGLVGPNMVREGFQQSVDLDGIHDFRGVTETEFGSWSPSNLRGIKPKCLDREDMQGLGLHIRADEGDRKGLDPCAVCCPLAQEQNCYGAENCPEVVP